MTRLLVDTFWNFEVLLTIFKKLGVSCQSLAFQKLSLIWKFCVQDKALNCLTVGNSEIGFEGQLLEHVFGFIELFVCFLILFLQKQSQTVKLLDVCLTNHIGKLCLLNELNHSESVFKFIAEDEYTCTNHQVHSELRKLLISLDNWLQLRTHKGVVLLSGIFHSWTRFQISHTSLTIYDATEWE